MAEFNLVIIPSEFIKIIPLFNGDPRQLNLFLRKCEYIIDRFRGDHEQNQYVMQVITSRLTDSAAALISERADIDTWAEFKELLLQHFGDPRSEQCIALNLESLKIKVGEPYLDFCKRVQSVRASLMAKVNNLNDPAMIASKTVIYDKMALNVFLFNLPENMVRIVRLHEPRTLEDALSVVLEETNFHELYQNKNKSNQHGYPKPQASIIPNTQFKFGNNTPLSNQPQGQAYRPNMYHQTQRYPQNQFRFGIPPGRQLPMPMPKPQFLRPSQPMQFGYRPQLQQFAGHPMPNNGFGYRPNVPHQMSPMRPQQFGQNQGFRPPQYNSQNFYPNDASMRTAPPVRPGFQVNETELYEADYPYYVEDPDSYGYASCGDDPYMYPSLDAPSEQSTPTLALRAKNTDKPDQTDQLTHDPDNKNQISDSEIENFYIRASTIVKK